MVESGMKGPQCEKVCAKGGFSDTRPDDVVYALLDGRFGMHAPQC